MNRFYLCIFFGGMTYAVQEVELNPIEVNGMQA